MFVCGKTTGRVVRTVTLAGSPVLHVTKKNKNAVQIFFPESGTAFTKKYINCDSIRGTAIKRYRKERRWWRATKDTPAAAFFATEAKQLIVYPKNPINVTSKLQETRP
jgi:hypothetical protein